MDKGMNFFYILSGPLGYVMEWIYKLLPNYGWDIILFTLLINIVKIPLQTSQQKSMAKMSAFQPMIAEIQTKYKDKPEKQQAELMKLQQDFGYKPTAGCMPMLLNFLVMFGVIGVVYNPEFYRADADFKLVAQTAEASHVAIPVLKSEDTAYLDALNTAIEELRADGTLKTLSEKYFGQDISSEN